MTDTLLSIPELDAPAKTPVVTEEYLPPREPQPNCLPDGIPLRLTAGIVVDLATLYAEEFAAYYPQRTDEFAFLLFMASQPIEDEGAAWRDGKPSLMGDFGAFRKVVLKWVSDNFRPSEATLIPFIALNLWMTAMGKKVTVLEDEQKKTDVVSAENPTIPTN